MRNTHAHAESPDSFPRQRLCSQIGRVVGTSDLPHFRSAESECGLGRRHQRAEPSRVLFIHESLWWRLCRAPETVRTATPQSHASDTTPRPSDVPLLAVYSSATPLLLAGASAGSFDHDSIRCDPRTSIPATHGQLCRADPRPRRDLIVQSTRTGKAQAALACDRKYHPRCFTLLKITSTWLRHSLAEGLRSRPDVPTIQSQVSSPSLPSSCYTWPHPGPFRPHRCHCWVHFDFCQSKGKKASLRFQHTQLSHCPLRMPSGPPPMLLPHLVHVTLRLNITSSFWLAVLRPPLPRRCSFMLSMNFCTSSSGSSRRKSSLCTTKSHHLLLVPTGTGTRVSSHESHPGEL